jgi:hypothetical protein
MNVYEGKREETFIDRKEIGSNLLRNFYSEINLRYL